MQCLGTNQSDFNGKNCTLFIFTATCSVFPLRWKRCTWVLNTFQQTYTQNIEREIYRFWIIPAKSLLKSKGNKSHHNMPYRHDVAQARMRTNAVCILYFKWHAVFLERIKRWLRWKKSRTFFYSPIAFSIFPWDERDAHEC